MKQDLTTNEIFYRRNLPHWYVEGASYFLTWRLAGTLPVSVIERLRDEYLDKQINSAVLYETSDPFFAEYDRLLDQSKTIRHLDDDRIAKICADALLFYHKKQYELISFCIMSNHVHAVITCYDDSKQLNKIMQSIKRHSARESNKTLGRSGAFWQEETYDHVIRDEGDLQRVIDYTINNPVKAELVADWKEWRWTYLHPEWEIRNKK